MNDIRRVWVPRARPDAERTAERLSGLGFTPLVAPLLTIRPLDVRPDLTGTQALAFTSRNGVRTFVGRARPPGLPVFAVGDATAAAAREAGFADVRSAGGDIHALAALIRTEGRGLSILHPCASEPVGNLAAEVGDAAHVVALPIYEAVETTEPTPEAWDAVLIHSPRAARALAARLDPEAATGRLAVAISEAAAAPLAAASFAGIRRAASPTETSLLATLGKPPASV